MTRGPERDGNSLGYTSWGITSFLLSPLFIIQQSPDLPGTPPPSPPGQVPFLQRCRRVSL